MYVKSGGVTGSEWEIGLCSANSGRSPGEIQRQLPDGESRPSTTPGPHRCLKVQILERPQRPRSSSAAAHGVSSLRRYLYRYVDPARRRFLKRMRCKTCVSSFKLAARTALPSAFS